MAAPTDPGSDHRRRGSRPLLPPRLNPSASPSTMAGKRPLTPLAPPNTSASSKKRSPEPPPPPPPRTESWHGAVAAGGETEKRREARERGKLLCWVELVNGMAGGGQFLRCAAQGRCSPFPAPEFFRFL